MLLKATYAVLKNTTALGFNPGLKIPVGGSLWENLPERKTATRPMSLIRVEGLDEKGHLIISKPLWLAWVLKCLH